MGTPLRNLCTCATAIALVAIGLGCDDEDDGGMQPPPGEQPTGPLSTIGLELIAEGFTSPVLLIEAPDDTGRLFVVDQIGVINIVTADGQMMPTPFLDLRDQVVGLMPQFDERGLLGLAFHPDFANNGRLYVYYSTWPRDDDFDHANNLSEFTVFADDPNTVNRLSERILLTIDQPQFNNNGGTLEFGPDGFLYLSTGDGGGGGDIGEGHGPMGNAQDIEVLMGKILRIDVDAMTMGGYGVPTDNPFVGTDGREEIYAYGFRNPYRFSFDVGGTNRLFAGDAGQNRWEEVSIVERGGNYGWNIREGTHCFDPNNFDDEPASCPEVGARGEPLLPPILEYPNIAQTGGIGLVVIGGYVYRGSALPDLQGDYIFGDFSMSLDVPSGQLFAAREQSDGTWQMRNLEIAGRTLGEFLRGFGRDRGGEIYVLTAAMGGPTGNTGRVYRIVSQDFVPMPPANEVAAQIERGSTLFSQNCARCHGESGMGTALAPQVIGPDALPLDPPPDRQLRTTQFVTALDVFNFAREFMPFDMPGSLPDQTYLDIVAFLVDANGITLNQVLTQTNAIEVVINQVP